MALPTFHDYHGYRIVVCVSERGNPIGRVHVYDPRDWNKGALYSTTSLDKAMDWIEDARPWCGDSDHEQDFLA